MFDRVVDRKALQRVVRRKGWDALLALLQRTYPDKKLYCVSMDWYTAPFALKCKGTRGDLLIGWKNS